MNGSWKSINSADKRKNKNWDLLPPKPERKATAFTVFADEKVTTANDDKSLQVAWSELSETNKRHYKSVATEQNKKEIEKWTKFKRDLKRPPGAYTLYMMDLWAEEKAKGKRLVLGQMSRKAKISWNRASQRTKAEYKTRARGMLIQYNAFYDGFRLGKAVNDDKDKNC